jgi:hypothetical protein
MLYRWSLSLFSGTLAGFREFFEGERPNDEGSNLPLLASFNAFSGQVCALFRYFFHLCSVSLHDLLVSYVFRATTNYFGSNLCLGVADVGSAENQDGLPANNSPAKDEDKSSSGVSDADSTALNKIFESSLETENKGRFKVSWREGAQEQFSTVENLVMVAECIRTCENNCPTMPSRNDDGGDDQSVCAKPSM